MIRFFSSCFSANILLLMLCQAVIAGDAQPGDYASRAKQRLEYEEAFSMEKFSKGTSKSLNEALEESQKALKNNKPSLKIDLKRAMSETAMASDVVVKTATEALGKNERKISIADIRAIALENNLAIKIATIEPVIAETVVSEERAKFDNIIFANVKYSRKDSPQISGDVVKFKYANPALDDPSPVNLSLQPQVTDFLEGVAGIAIPLRTGGTVKLSSPFENKKTSGILGSDEYRSALRFSITQPLLRDAGISTNEASINIAQFERQAIDLKTRLQSIRVISIIDKAYWSMYATWGELDIRRQQYEYASQNLAMVRKRVEEGLTAAIEINRAEIGVADRVESLIVAKTNLKLSQRQLKFLLNDKDYNLSSPVIFIPTTLPTLVSYDFDREKLVEQALGGRLELLELELKLAADLTKIDYLENQTLPLFTLDYSYGALSGSGGNFGKTYGDVLDNRFNDWSIGLRFELPMTNEARRAQLDRAVQQRLQRLTTRTLQEQTVRREIYDVLDQEEQNWQRILAARQQVVLAGMNYEAELKQFNEGLRTMTEVLETLTRLGEAQIKEIRAVTDYQVSLIDLAYATGTLLGYSRVNF